MLELLHELDEKTFNWFNTQDVTESIEFAKKNEITTIVDPITKSQWKEFEAGLEDFKKTRIIVVNGLPDSWISLDHLKVINVQRAIREPLAKLNDKIKNYSFNHHKIDVNHLEFDFFLSYGRWEFHRESIFKELHSRKIIEKSLYSCPSVKGRDARSIENVLIAPPTELRFDHKKNFNFMLKNIQQTNCAIVLENNGLLAESDCSISEKSLWPMFAQVPFIWILSYEKIKQMQKWGFEPAETPANTVKEICKQLLWLHSEFSNKNNAQKWQDHMGNTTNKNLSLAKKLLERIEEDIHNQYRQLKISH